MPTYVYRCPDGHTFERFQKITARPQAKCPTCGQPAQRQITGGAGLVFKGSGFYITDYKRGAEKKKPAEQVRKKSAEGGATAPRAKEEGATSKRDATGTRDAEE